MMVKKCAIILCAAGLSMSTFANKEITTDIRYVPEFKDDLVWENDLIAFRAYGPRKRRGKENNGFDCWLKRVKYPIIENWYTLHKQGKSYHDDRGEGHDPYHVGPTAGTGGTGIWLDGKRHGLETYTSHEILETGKEKSRCKISYERTIQGIEYKEEKLITIELGNRYFDVESVFYKDGKIAANEPICIGITIHDGKAQTLSDSEKGWIGSWEKIDGYGLGTGVVIDPTKIDEIKIVKKKRYDSSHIFIIIKTDSEGKLRYKAGYGWEKAGEITTQEQWTAYLNTIARSNLK